MAPASIMGPIFRDYILSLSLAHWAAGVTAALAAVALCQFVYNVYLHPLADFPGPLLWRGSNLPKIVHQFRGDIHDRMLDMHLRYGSVVRLAPGELTFTSDAAVRDIYGNRGGKKTMPPQSSLGKNDMKMFGATSFIWIDDHHEHLRHRKVLSASFSDASLKAQEPIVLGYAARLTQQFRERARRGEVVDAWAWFNYLTFDVIGDLTFGESFDCVKDGQFHPWISFIFSNLYGMMFAQIVTTLGAAGAAIEALVPQRVWAEAVAHAQSTRDKVDRRLARKTQRPDFVTGFLRHVGAPGGISPNELYADSNVFLIAGSETTATLLAVALYQLLRSPAALARLRAELAAAVSSSEADLDFAAVARLPYLNAVISEALRIHPPLPASINRVVPAGGAVVDGRFVAAGTVLQVPHWPAFHLDANFRDPWAFVPERWLEGPGQCPDRYAADNRAVFIPFSYGQRNCIGRQLALMEVRITLARLVYAFDMELMPESRAWNQQRVFLLYEKKPLYVKFSERVRSPAAAPEASEKEAAALET